MRVSFFSRSVGSTVHYLNRPSNPTTTKPKQQEIRRLVAKRQAAGARAFPDET